MSTQLDSPWWFGVKVEINESVFFNSSRRQKKKKLPFKQVKYMSTGVTTRQRIGVVYLAKVKTKKCVKIPL